TRVVRPVHALPLRHHQVGAADAGTGMGQGAAGRSVTSDARRFHLRAGAGGAESGGLGAALFCTRGGWHIEWWGEGMNAKDLPEDMTPVPFTFNGMAVEAAPGESLLKVAQRAGVTIPHLCHQDGLRSPGNCRACVVEIEGERVLAPSCCRAP